MNSKNRSINFKDKAISLESSLLFICFGLQGYKIKELALLQSPKTPYYNVAKRMGLPIFLWQLFPRTNKLPLHCP